MNDEKFFLSCAQGSLQTQFLWHLKSGFLLHLSESRRGKPFFRLIKLMTRLFLWGKTLEGLMESTKGGGGGECKGKTNTFSANFKHDILKMSRIFASTKPSQIWDATNLENWQLGTCRLIYCRKVNHGRLAYRVSLTWLVIQYVKKLLNE